MSDLKDMTGRVCLVTGATYGHGRALAGQLLKNKERLNQHERDLRDKHFTRLREGLSESHETSAIHLDFLTHLKRVNSCVSHVAYAIVQNEKSTSTA